MLRGSNIFGILVYGNFIVSSVCVCYSLFKVDVITVAIYAVETWMVFCVLVGNPVSNCFSLFSFGSAALICTL